MVPRWLFQRLTSVANDIRRGAHSCLAPYSGEGLHHSRLWQQVSSMTSLHTRFAAVAPTLLPVSAPRKIPHPNCRPAQFGHHLRQAPVCARRAIALRDFKQIQQRLAANPFQPVIEVNFAAHALQTPAATDRPISAAAALAASSRILSLNDSALTSRTSL